MTNAADEKLQTVLNRLPREKVRCVDVETSGLNYLVNHIVGYVFTFSPNPKDSYYIPFRHKEGGNVGGQRGPQDKEGWDGKLHPAEKKLIGLIDVPDTLMFGHNIAFDLKFLSRSGMTAIRPRIEDSMINAPLLNEYEHSYKLEHLADKAKVAAKKSARMNEYLCAKFPEAAARPKAAMGHYWRLAGDDAMAVEYAEGDGTSTWQLRDWQMPQINNQGLNLVHDIESRLIPVLARMSIKGIKIDEDRLDWLQNYVGESIEALMGRFPSGFNVRSPVDVLKWMEKHGHTDWPMTPPSKTRPQGSPSMRQDWLENSEAGRQIVAVRKLETMKSTFIDPMAEGHLFKGRVHTSYNQLRSDEYGTITGRLSCSDPNLQAVPKHDETMGRLFRSIFIPDEGRIWGSRDYSQMEPRLLAFYAQCKLLLDGYNAHPPVDAHTAASMGACGKRWDTMTPAQRKAYRDDRGKRINQTIITGGGKKVLVSKYKVPADEVDEVWDNYHKAMPEIGKLQKRAASQMRREGFVFSLLRRRARLQDSDKDYVAVNRLLQVGNADCIKLKMVQIDDYLAAHGRPIDMINTVHDSLDFQFPEKERHHYAECVSIMENFGPGQVIYIPGLPITTDGDEGSSWSTATYGPEKE